MTILTILSSIHRNDFGPLVGDEQSGHKIYDYLCFLRCVPPSPKDDADAALDSGLNRMALFELTFQEISMNISVKCNLW